MKKILTIVLGLFIAVSAISCSNQTSDGDPYDFFEVTDVTGWDNIDDVWENLNSSGVGSWIKGKWNYQYRAVTNYYNSNGDVERVDASAVVNFAGDTSSSSVTFSNVSDETIFRDPINTLGQFKNNMDSYYSDNVWKDFKSQLTSSGIRITSSKNENVWRKVNQSRTKMEFYKSIIISGTDGNQEKTLVVQMNESFVKQ